MANTSWLACKFKRRVTNSHTGKQKHAAGEYHGTTILIKTHAGSQFSMEAKIVVSNGFLVQLLTHQKWTLHNDELPFL